MSILMVTVFAVYAPSLDNGFVSDDHFLLVENTALHQMKNPFMVFLPEYGKQVFISQRAKEKGKNPVPGMETGTPVALKKVFSPYRYRPMRGFTFFFEYRVFGKNPQGYHLTNLILHLANTWVVFFLVQLFFALQTKDRCPDPGSGPEVGAKKSRFSGAPFAGLSPLVPAFWSAMLFALHPAATEAVCWIKNRTTLLCFLFVCLSLFFLVLSACRYPKKSNIVFFLLSLGSFVLALLSKETAIVLPLLAACAVFLIVPEKSRQVFRVRILPYIAILLMYGIFICFGFFHEKGLADDPMSFFRNQDVHFVRVLGTGLYYIKMLVLPCKPTLDIYPVYGLPFFQLISLLVLAGTGLFLYLGPGFVSWDSGWKKLWFFPFFWTCITMLPVLNFIPIESRPLAGQRIYLPMFGFCLGVVLMTGGLFSRANALFAKKRENPGILSGHNCLFYGFLLLIALGYGTITRERTKDWKDLETLICRNLEIRPDHPGYHYMAGVHYQSRNIPPEQEDIQKSLFHLEKTLELSPFFPGAALRAAGASFALGDMEKAGHYARKAMLAGNREAGGRIYEKAKEQKAAPEKGTPDG